jgi:hypothetical protein
MKLTKPQLVEIIKKELNALLNEAEQPEEQPPPGMPEFILERPITGMDAKMSYMLFARMIQSGGLGPNPPRNMEELEDAYDELHKMTNPDDRRPLNPRWRPV